MHDNYTSRTGSKRAFFPKYLKAFFPVRAQRALLYALRFTLYAASCTSNERQRAEAAPAAFFLQNTDY